MKISGEQQYIGKQHWWIRFSCSCLVSFYWICNKVSSRSMMHHSVIRDHHEVISILSMRSFVIPIFSSTDKPRMNEHFSLSQWSLGLFAILFSVVFWDDFQTLDRKDDDWHWTRIIHAHLSILVALKLDRCLQQLTHCVYSYMAWSKRAERRQRS